MVKTEHFHYTIKPGISSTITLKTLPEAICSLHEDGKRTPALELYSDDDGIVRFYCSPNQPPETILKLVLDCKVDDRVTHYPLELRISSMPTQEMPTQEMPTPPYESPKPEKKVASMRLALSEQDMLNLTYSELVERGYPPRPDPTDVRSFNQWKRIVSAFNQWKFATSPGRDNS